MEQNKTLEWDREKGDPEHGINEAWMVIPFEV